MQRRGIGQGRRGWGGEGEDTEGDEGGGVECEAWGGGGVDYQHGGGERSGLNIRCVEVDLLHAFYCRLI